MMLWFRLHLVSFLFFFLTFNHKESEDEEEEEEEKETTSELKVTEIKQVQKKEDVNQTSNVKLNIENEAREPNTEEENDVKNTTPESDELRKIEVLNKEELVKDLDEIPEIKISSIQDDGRKESGEEFSEADVPEINSQSAINKSDVIVNETVSSLEDENKVIASQVEGSGETDNFVGKVQCANLLGWQKKNTI